MSLLDERTEHHENLDHHPTVDQQQPYDRVTRELDEAPEPLLLFLPDSFTDIGFHLVGHEGEHHQRTTRTNHGQDTEDLPNNFKSSVEHYIT